MNDSDEKKYPLKTDQLLKDCLSGGKSDSREPETISSRIKNAGRFRLVEKILKGQKGEYPYSYIKIKSGVVVLPFYNGKIVAIRQFRPAFEKFLYELPAGVIDEGELPEQTAIRELKEETGYIAENAKYLGCFYPSPGATEEVIELYLAECTGNGEQQPEISEQIDVCVMDIAEFENKIKNNEFLHGGGIAAYLKYKLLCGKET